MPVRCELTHSFDFIVMKDLNCFVIATVLGTRYVDPTHLGSLHSSPPGLLVLIIYRNTLLLPPSLHPKSTLFTKSLALHTPSFLASSHPNSLSTFPASTEITHHSSFIPHSSFLTHYYSSITSHQSQYSYSPHLHTTVSNPPWRKHLHVRSTRSRPGYFHV